MTTAYFIRYRLYGINNVMHFHGSAQYQNWTSVMEENFKDQFKIISIDTYDI